EPAAACGIVGIKPTYGRVSMRGVIPLAISLDHVGPLTTCVSDAAILLQAVAGYDPLDPTTLDVPVEDYAATLASPNGELRVGVPRKFFYEDLNTEVATAVEAALRQLSGLVREIREVTLDVPTDRSLQAAESYAYHAEHVTSTPDLYQPETLRRIRSGEGIGAEAVSKLRDEIREIRRHTGELFREVDVLVTPTTPVPPPSIAELSRHPDNLRPAELVLLRNTRPFNVWGLPAIAVPCGFTSTGLPIGLQIAGPHWSEPMILSAAYAYEQQTEWHRRKPPLFS